MKTTGGEHLGTMRSWIQWHCHNGSDVTWGSEEPLRFSNITVREMEELAERIKKGCEKDIFRSKSVISIEIVNECGGVDIEDEDDTHQKWERIMRQLAAKGFQIVKRDK